MQSDFTFEIVDFPLSLSLSLSLPPSLPLSAFMSLRIRQQQDFHLYSFSSQHETIQFAGERTVFRNYKSMPSDEYFVISEKEKQ